MEKMKINSKTEYNKDRVMSGYAPHELLNMIQQEASEKQVQVDELKNVPKMSIRNYDRCSCDHNRENHSDFSDECSKCSCVAFHGKMRLKSYSVQKVNSK